MVLNARCGHHAVNILMLNDKINISYVRKCTCKGQKSFYQQYFAIRSTGTLKGDGHKFGLFFFVILIFTVLQ